METSSEKLFARSQRVAPGGVHSPVRAFKSVGGTPIFFRRAEGPYLETVSSERLIDFCQSFGPHILGHRDPDVQREVERAVADAWAFGACDPYSLELAEWICGELPWVEKIRFVCSGTEAVMSALRLARAYTGRTLILKFDGCYHGHVDSMLVKAGSGLAGGGLSGQAASDSAGVSEQQALETLVCPLNDLAALRSIFSEYKGRIAGVIVEPLPANYGLLPQEPQFFHELAKLCKDDGALLIFDEVISGFRVAMGGMAERLSLRPDLVTFGKIIGGGFPVGAYAGRAEILDLVAPSGPVYQAGTLAANPIGCRAGLTVLKKLKTEGVHKELSRRTEIFAAQLRNGFSGLGLPLQVISEGSIFWIYRSSSKEVFRAPSQFHPEQKSDFARLFHECLKEGIYLPPSGYEVGFVSYAHTEALLAVAAEGIVEAAKRAYA
jgi:glutamate-1-semialdehyde 2,1-aminomutase